MRKLLLFTIIILHVGSICAQTSPKIFNLSVWDPLATSPYKIDNTVLFSVGLLQSKVNNLHGLDANVVSAITTGRMSGVQVSGAYSSVEGAAKGVTISGFYNLHKATMSGLEIGGLANMNMVNQHGVQLSSVQNICMFNTDGVQVASLMNVTGQTLSGVQIAGGFNVANISRGVQIAGIVNFALDDCRGVQIAGFNYSTEMKGVQVGAANFARKMKGVQVGVVNYSADSSTFKIGLVSISPRTKIRPMLYYSNLATFNIGFRFMNRISYSILGLGTPYDAPHSTSSGMFFYRLGIYKNIGAFTVSSDAGVSYITKFVDDGEKNALSMEGRFNLEVALNKRISVFGSGGYSVRRFFAKHGSAELKPILEIGLLLPNLLKSSR